jgi:hypothetical protein
MKKQKINLSYRSYSDSAFLNKAGHIVSSMTNNIYFSNPVPPLADVQDALDAYSTALVAAADLGRVNVANKNKAREVLEKLLAQLGMYVMYVANGDVLILTSSGYTLSKSPEPRYIENPGNVTLTNGITSGEIIGAVKNVATSGYTFEITDTLPTEETIWLSTPSSKSQFTFKNLVAGKQYWIRVAALGKRSQVAYSTVATMFAQ